MLKKWSSSSIIIWRNMWLWSCQTRATCLFWHSAVFKNRTWAGGTLVWQWSHPVVIKKSVQFLTNINLESTSLILSKCEVHTCYSITMKENPIKMVFEFAINYIERCARCQIIFLRHLTFWFKTDKKNLERSLLLLLEYLLRPPI